MPHYPSEIEYSDKYNDDYYEYRHVILPKETYRKMPRGRLLTENVIIFHHSGMENHRSSAIQRLGPLSVSYTHLTLPTIYSV